jgi:hypothetical protein
MPLIGGKPILAPPWADISPQSHKNGKGAFAPQALGKGFDDAAAGNLPITSNRITPRREICEAPAEIPQTPARGGVISLGVSPLGSLAVEIETCLPFENWRSGDVEDGVGPFLDAALRFEAALDDHLGFHESRRVQAIDRDARSFDLFGEVEREHHQRELALTVGSKTVVAACEHHVGEVNPLLPRRGHVDDPGGRALEDQRQKQMGVSRKGAR